MEILEAIEKRRAIKHFDTEHRMSDAEINQLMSTTILSPTSFNIQNWRFVIVQDPALRQEIRKAAWDQAQVSEASLLIVLCADNKSWEEPERYWETAPEETRNFLVNAIKGFYKDRKDLVRDEAMRSCGIAAQTIMLTAKSMGYDSCPMVGFDFDKVAELINLPQDHVVSMLVVVGKAIQEAYPRGGQLPLEEVVIHDKF